MLSANLSLYLFILIALYDGIYRPSRLERENGTRYLILIGCYLFGIVLYEFQASGVSIDVVRRVALPATAIAVSQVLSSDFLMTKLRPQSRRRPDDDSEVGHKQSGTH